MMTGILMYLLVGLTQFHTSQPSDGSSLMIADSLIVDYYIQGNPHPNMNRTDEQGRRQGLWVTYHPNNMVESMGYFVDSLRDGAFVFINERGWVIAEENYRMGVFDGTQRYYNFGQLTKLAMYKNGQLDGIYETYSRNQIIAERHFYENGVKHGLSTWFFDNGKPSFVYPYDRGKIEGEVKVYYQSGAIKSVTKYMDNEMNGAHFEYHETGIMALSGQYKKGQKKGEWITYNEQGDPIKKEKF
jgi:antitoxin component YwqK of YwqJK toxin-antitoxin module